MKLGHQKIHIAGHSLGGMIGPAYALAYPQHTLSVSLLSTAAGRSEEDRAKLQAVGNAMEQNGIVETLGTFVARWFTDDFMATHPEVIEARLQQVKDTPADVFLSVFWIYAQTEMAPWLQRVTCPCLVLTGELDGGCNPRLNRFIDTQLPDSRLVILPGLKHSSDDRGERSGVARTAKILTRTKLSLIPCAGAIQQPQSSAFCGHRDVDDHHQRRHHKTHHRGL